MHINNFAEVMSACRFCFMCRHLSAVGLVSGHECDTPRGHALIADLIRMHPEKLQDADLVDAVYRSDLSGANRFHCDGYHDGKGYDELGLQLALRCDIVEAGTEPETVKKLAEEFESSSTWQVSGTGDTLYFLDNRTAQIPEIAKAFTKLANAGGITFRTITGGCIGKALLTLGYVKRAESVARKFAQFVDALGTKQLVVSNPAAYDMLSRNIQELGIQLRTPVMHSSEFISKLQLKFKPSENPVCYLESDFLKNYQRALPYPAKLLSQVGVKCVPFGTNSEESRNAGEGAIVLDRLHPELVKMMTARVVENTGSEPLVTASAYVRNLLAQAGLKVITLEELAAMQLEEN